MKILKRPHKVEKTQSGLNYIYPIYIMVSGEVVFMFGLVMLECDRQRVREREKERFWLIG